MVFEEIVLGNFATYKGQNTINLLPSSPERPVILIGGENGCGKTTLLDAFQLVLFGPAGQCSNRGKLAYETYLERCINRETSQDDGARIKLTFHFFSAGESKRYRIERVWFKKGKKVKEQFWVYQLTGGEIRYEKALSENWADYVEGFFPSQISPFFFFDGEKIEELADFEKSGYLIQAAINSLLGLNIVNQLNTDLISIEKNKHKELASKDEQEIVDTLENELKGLSSRIDVTRTEEAQLNNRIDIISRDLEMNEVKYRQQGGDLFERRSSLEEQLRLGQQAVAIEEEQLRNIATGAAPLLLVKHLLQGIKVQAQTEEHAHREQLLCETLDRRDQELLNKLSTLQAKVDTINEIKLHLQTDRDARRKTADVERYICLDADDQKSLDILLESDLPSLGKSIPDALAKLQSMREAVEAIERSLAGVPDEATISVIIVERESLREKLKKEDTLLRVAREEIERAKRQYELKNGELRRELTRTANIRFEGKDTRRTIQFSAKVRNTLAIFREKVVEKHMSRIEELVLKSFKDLLRKKTLVDRLEIDRSTCQIRLYKKKNEEVLPERLSAGERQLLATAILWGICQAAGKPLPTIIDTPLGRLDTSHRTNLVQNYFPHASHQVLLLSTNEEIVGKYYEELKPYISQTYLLSHDEISSGTTVRQGYFS